MDSIYENLSKVYFPARANFYIQSNLTSLKAFVQSLITERNRIIEHYGEPNEQGLFQIKDEKMLLQANKELDELLSLEINLEIKEIPLSWLEGVRLSLEQMNAISFMIQED